MRCRPRILPGMLLLALVVGCGQSNTPSGPAAPTNPATANPAAPAAQPATPAAAPAATTGAQNAAAPADLQTASADPASAVRAFLEAVRTGNDKRAEQMMSKVALENLRKQQMNVAPPGSDTARFEIGKVETLAADAARVSATWTDFDGPQQKTDNMLWMLRKDPEGWRIMGTAIELFPGEAPLLLDFEQPEETRKKVQWAKEEMQRRQESQNLQAQQPQNSASNVQR